mmetsp:Transcript_28755/g.70897  ORF Transcript_28755/g.70897 Transcript_28755/m.70897 type:complete len:241 (+) Transcript_28755:142-864(+)
MAAAAARLSPVTVDIAASTDERASLHRRRCDAKLSTNALMCSRCVWASARAASSASLSPRDSPWSSSSSASVLLDDASSPRLCCSAARVPATLSSASTSLRSLNATAARTLANPSKASTHSQRDLAAIETCCTAVGLKFAARTYFCSLRTVSSSTSSLRYVRSLCSRGTPARSSFSLPFPAATFFLFFGSSFASLLPLLFFAAAEESVRNARADSQSPGAPFISRHTASMTMRTRPGGVG